MKGSKFRLAQKGMQFEKKFAGGQGSKFAVSAATGTAALHVGLTALAIRFTHLNALPFQHNQPKIVSILELPST